MLQFTLLRRDYLSVTLEGDGMRPREHHERELHYTLFEPTEVELLRFPLLHHLDVDVTHQQLVLSWVGQEEQLVVLQ